MKKKFNTTGTCYPQHHYMMDNSKKLEYVFNLIEQGKYFSIHHPRQYGKTTILYTITKTWQQSDDYFAIALNFQGIDRQFHQSDTAFGQMFIAQIIKKLKLSAPDSAKFLIEQGEVNSLSDVSDFITALVLFTRKKLVLLIDEVDASSEYAAFINFLGMLRNKFLIRVEEPTFYSVVLAGVHDIKNLKFKLRNPEEAKYNSPWNIAVDFEIDMSFNPQEIAPMLEQYSEAEDIAMDIPKIAERLYYHTSGYPFLVSKLCKKIAEKVLKTKPKTEQNQWTLEDVEASVRILLKENNTNFDSLFGNLENHQDLYNLVHRIIFNGETIPFNQYNPTIYKGILYGIFKRNGQIKIHNRIYEQLIYDYLASKLLTNSKEKLNYSGFFLNDNGSLDMAAALKKFQSYMKEQRSTKDLDFLEREWRLIFLAYLHPILNGKGYSFKEVETSEEKRLDIVVTYLQYKYIIELKIWRGPKAHKSGLNQLADYLDIHGVDTGFLLIFDTRKKKLWEAKPVQHKGKEVFAVWV